MLSIYFCCFCKSEIMVKNTHVEHNCINEGTVLLFCKSKTISATFYRHVASLVKGEGQKNHWTRNLPSLKSHC